MAHEKYVSAPLDLPRLDLLRRYSVMEAMAYLGISRKHFYDKIAAGELKVIKDGRRTFVSGAEIARLSRV